ncbi:erythrocyte membrane protein 1, PfEMP1, putative [Plasmodium sp. DRC-Itaito]|nr:erythrocyte membrane protein 1, PfEMP1, putative [Plasmodium sp. DRC-Itaito]
MGPQAAFEPNYKDAKDAKELLDMIGEAVHRKLHNDALDRGKGLKGFLTKATFPKDGEHDKPAPKSCELNYEYDTNVRWGVINPCEHKSLERFSEVSGGECDNSKIKGNEDNKVGACAPFRRLHVCDKNMEKITETNTTTTDNLLVDVLLAAKYEGASIKGYYTKYQQKYGDSDSTMCTMLARSFADIGDIIRGKDLFLGYNETDKVQKEKIEQNLQGIFKKIHGKLKSKIKAAYNRDNPDYYKLREDWWEANRREVWKAMTCEAPISAHYFRQTCGKGKKARMTESKCRCRITNDVPTYFDYVPQYLRWFEEWAEDFCRKRKHKLKEAIKNCRGEENEKYCSRNGFDCTKTIRGKNHLVKGDECHNCYVTCTNFEPWIDNERGEFEKQKEKYKNEIKKAEEKEVAVNRKNNNIYEKEFYRILKNEYESVENFLKKLNEEKICMEKAEVGGEKANAVDFTEDSKVIFSHTEYCNTCPWCETKKKGEGGKMGKWENEKHEKCTTEGITTFNENDATNIHLLPTDKGKGNILDKYKEFCEKDNGKRENWKCRFEDSDKDNCILKDGTEGTQNRKIKPYDALMWGWISEMLEDSKKWRTDHSMCINNKGAAECKEECKNTCKCFLKWVQQKEKEWMEIKHHFDQQKDMDENADAYTTLKAYLQIFFMDKIEEAYGKDKCEELEEKLSSIQGFHGEDAEHSEDAIKFLIDHEKEIAEKCIENDKRDACQEKERKSQKDRKLDPKIPPTGRSEDTEGEGPKLEEEGDPSAVSEQENEEEEEDEDDELEKEVDQDGDQETVEEISQTPAETATPSPTATVEDHKVCNIVNDILTKTEQLQDACKQKYEKGREKFPNWKCVTTTKPGDTAATGDVEARRKRRQAEPSSATGDGKTTEGGICVPPRRRKLYLGGFYKLLEGTAGVAVSQESGTERGAPSQSSNEEAQKKLLEAFVQSAAVETWFLWYNYNKIKKKEIEDKKKEKELNVGLLTLEIPDTDDENKTPQTKLEEGEIPADFLRQMFYTLGDYRDIAVGVPTDVGEALKKSFVPSSGKTEESGKEAQSDGDQDILGKIEEKIKTLFPNGESKPPPPTPSSSSQPTDVKKWWNDTLGPAVWNGMVCALTYNTDTEKDTPPQQIPEVETALFGEKRTGDEGPEKSGTQEGTFHTQYNYKTVSIDANETEEMAQGAGRHDHEGTKLTDFIKRPPYFRYLEEWGENFCKKRNEMLEKIEVDCQVQNASLNNKAEPKCSCYGESCKDIFSKKYDVFPSLGCQDCGKYCAWYKKWITKKKDEYEKQEKIYKKQKENCEKERNDTKEFCAQIEKSQTSGDFLSRLKSGPCKNDDSPEGTTFFDEKGDIFHLTEYCKPCSDFKVKCNEHGNCRSGDGKDYGCNGRTAITKEDIEKNTDGKGNIVMRVSDNSANGSQNDLNVCIDACIFKGISKEQWKCSNVCGYVVCKTDQSNAEIFNKKQHGENQFISIRALVKHWVQIFLEDYNKIRKKLNLCIKNGIEFTCQNKCDKKGKCAEEWLNKKQEEWGKIRERFLEEYKGPSSDEYFNVKSSLEEFKDPTELNNVLQPCPNISEFEKSIHCNGAANSKGRNPEKRDVVLCLIGKLQNEIKTYQEQHNGNDCSSQPQILDLVDEEEPLEPLEETNTTNTVPKFCPKMDTPPDEPGEPCKPTEAPKEAETAVPAVPAGESAVPGMDDSTVDSSDSTDSTDSNDNSSGTGKGEKEQDEEEEEDKSRKNQPIDVSKKEEAPAKTTSRRPPPVRRRQSTSRRRRNPELQQPYISKPLFDAMLSNTLAWCIGIGITGLSYWALLKVRMSYVWYLYVCVDFYVTCGFVCIFRKTKRPVELFSVLDIPKGEYDIPTEFSSNRYVPYGTGKHRGKRYIYIEGDTDDEKYIGGITSSDITSSSESEYEEIDLHVPHAPPKYKTLIEVVLETSTSGKNAPNSDNTIRISGNTIPTTADTIPNSDIPTPPITDDEWNTLKNEFISQYIEHVKPDISTESPLNTHPTPSDNNVDQKPFIMSIHDRNLLSGEEYSYDMINSGENDLHSDIDRISGNLGSYSDKNGSYSGKNGPYSGIDLINDSLNSGNHIDIYDEMLKRKENELFGTNHPKHTSTHNVAKPARDDPLLNKINLFHKWLDRHRNMCEKWNKNNKKEELLDKLKEEWNKDYNSGNINPSGNDIPSSNKTLNTDVSIQIDMDTNPVENQNPVDSNPDKSTMDTILDDLEKYNEPYYDIYEDGKPSVDDNIYVDHNNMHNNNAHVLTKVQTEINAFNNNTTNELLEEEYPIADMWDM